MKKDLIKQTIYITALLIIMVVGPFGVVAIQSSGVLVSTNSKQHSQQKNTNSHQLSVTKNIVTRDVLSSQKNSATQNTVTSQKNSGNYRNSVQKRSNLQTTTKTLPSQKTLKSQSEADSHQLTVQNQQTKSFSITLTSISIVQSPSPVDVGSSVTITASAVSMATSYSWSGLPTGCSGSTSRSFSCTPTAIGTSSVSVFATSGAGNIVGSGSGTVTVVAKPTSASISANASTGDALQAVSFTASLTGGNGASSYTWYGLPSGCTSISTNPLICTPSDSSTTTPYNVYVRVYDKSNNYQTSSSMTYTVSPTLYVSPPSLSPSNLDLTHSVTMTTSATGGKGTFIYSWVNLPTGCSSSNSASITCTPTVTGTFKIYAKVTDGNSNTVLSGGNTHPVYSTLTISPVLSVSVSASPGSGGIDLGQSTTFTATAKGGSGTYSSYTWSGVPTGCTASTTSSFTCKPTALGPFSVSVIVKDSFTYTASGSLSYSVKSDPTISISPSPSSGGIDVGQTVVFTAIASSGSGGFSYTWNSPPTGCSATTNSLTCTLTAANTYSINAGVTDSNGFYVSSSINYVVKSDPTILTPSSTIASKGIDVGQTTTFKTTASGGSGSYSYIWYNLPTGCTTSNTNSLPCTPNTAGTYSVYVNVTDSNGFTTKSGLLTYIVLSDPTATIPTGTPGSSGIDVGQTTTLSTTASGGSGGYSYIWYNLPTGCTTSNSNSLTCTPTASGSFNFYVNVTDSNGFTSKISSSGYTVIADPTISAPGASIASGSLDAGHSITFTVTASSGSSPYTYTWNGLPTGCTSTNSNSITCTPSEGGTFSINVTLTDSNNFQLTGNSLSYTILAKLSITTPAASITSSDVGQSVTFTTTGSGGTTSYTYAWNGLPSGCSTSNSNYISCSPSTSGKFNISVVMTDSNGYKVTSGNLTYTVFSAPSTTTLSSTIISGGLDVGQSTTFSITVSGGTGTYSYLWSGLPAGCSTANTNSLTCIPSTSGKFSIYVTVTDSNNYQVTSSTLSYTILSDPTVGTPSASVSSIDVGQSVSFSASASNGIGPYTYSWTSLPTGCTDSGTSSVTCTPSSSGTFSVSIKVTDSNGYTVSSSALSFTIAKPLSVNTISSNTTNIDLNQAVNFTVSLSNGVSPYSYSWNLPQGCVSSNSNSIICSPSSTGSFTINVTATDGNNFSVNSSNLLLTVISDPSAGSPTSTIASGGIDAGQHVTFTSATPTGGAGSYVYAWNNLPTGCTDSGANSVSCNPTAGGTFAISVTITDANGYTAQSATLTYLVYPSITVLAPTSNVSSVDLGQSAKFTVAASGGTGSYTYVYNGLPLGCTSLNANTISCTPSSAGSYTLSVSVTDTNSVTVTGSSLSFNVYTVPTVSAPTTSTSPISVGDTVVFTTTASGGSGSFSYTWTSSANLKCSGSLTNRITCTPDQAGSYTLKVTVTDSNGISATTTTNITVKPSQTTTSSTTPSSPTSTTSSKKGKSSPGFSAIIGLVGIIMSAGVLTYNRRRKNY